MRPPAALVRFAAAVAVPSAVATRGGARPGGVGAAVLGLLLALALAPAPGAAEARRVESSAGPLVAERVGPELEHPWAVAFLPDVAGTGALLVTERDGRLRLIEGGRAREVAGLPEVSAGGQGGLLDVALAPDFAESGVLYLAHSAPAAGGARNTVVTRARLDRAGARLTDAARVFEAASGGRGGRHFGSRLVFGADGTLWITVGDRGEDETAQDPFSPNGKVHRIAPDGSVPADNPFADGRGALATVWSLGHRNPQGAARHPATGELWTVSHGARGGDEVNVARAGLNYGWPVISYGRHYSGMRIGEGTEKPGMEQPLHYWDPSIAPSGAAFGAGGLLAGWEGDLFVGALRDEAVVRLELDGERVVGAETLFEGAFGRVRDVRFGPDGALWLLTDEDPGGLWRIAPAP